MLFTNRVCLKALRVWGANTPSDGMASLLS